MNIENKKKLIAIAKKNAKEITFEEALKVNELCQI